MQKTTKLAIAGLLNAAGAFFTAFAAEFSGEGSETTETTSTPKTRKPRNSAAATTETTTGPAEATSTVTAEPETGKTYEELKALIKPHVEGGKGQEVKDIIKKYSATGLKDIKAEHHEAFEKDLETLSY